MTGSSIRPSLYNRPLPRLTPQPEHISLMIFKRRKARQRRGAHYADLRSMRDDVRREVQFEASLTAIADQPFERAFDSAEDWGTSQTRPMCSS
jgi:protocatechuate 3,4-dioxygenase beta subunit